MKTLRELIKEIEDSEEKYGIPECSLTDLMYRELLENDDVAMRMFLDVCIDFCNCWDRLDLMEEIWEAMIEGEYEPTYNIFKTYLVDSMIDGKPRYIPQDEEEMNAVLDEYQRQKKQREEWQNENIRKFGVEWLSMDGRDRLRLMWEDMQKEMEKNPLPPQSPPENNNDDGIDYLPF